MRIVLIALVLMGLSVEANAQLSEQAQARVYERQLQQAMQRGDGSAALQIISSYRQDISDVPAAILYIEARLARDEGQYERSLTAVQTYLNAASGDEPQYDGAVDLYAEVEPLAVAERRRAAAQEAARLERERQARLDAQRRSRNSAHQEFIDTAQSALTQSGPRLLRDFESYLVPSNVRFEGWGSGGIESRQRVLAEIQRATSGRRSNLTRRLSEVQGDEMWGEASPYMDGINISDPNTHSNGGFPVELIMASYDRSVMSPSDLGRSLLEIRNRITPLGNGFRMWPQRSLMANGYSSYFNSYGQLSRYELGMIIFNASFRGDLARLAVRGRLDVATLDQLIGGELVARDHGTVSVTDTSARIDRAASRYIYNANGPAIVVTDVAAHGLHGLDAMVAVRVMSILDAGRTAALADPRQTTGDPTLGAFVQLGRQLVSLGTLLVDSDQLEETDKIVLLTALEELYFDPSKGDAAQFWRQQMAVPRNCSWDPRSNEIRRDFIEVTILCGAPDSFTGCSIPSSSAVIVEFFRERGIRSDCGAVQ